MSSTYTLDQRIVTEAGTLQAQAEFTGTLEVNLAGEVIAADASDQEIGFDLDVSAVQAMYILADQDLTIETNDAESPDDTLSLKANKPYIWHTGGYFTNVFDTDITSLFVTNGSGTATNLYIRALVDPSPA